MKHIGPTCLAFSEASFASLIPTLPSPLRSPTSNAVVLATLPTALNEKFVVKLL
jgi:hypothetical protein